MAIENGSLNELLAELGKAASIPTELDPELKESLNNLSAETAAQIRELQKAGREGKISDRQQEAATKALQKNMAELQESMKLATTTQEDATKAIEASTKIAKKNLETQKKALEQGKNMMRVQRQRVGFQGQGSARAQYVIGAPGRAVSKVGRIGYDAAKDGAVDLAKGMASKAGGLGSGLAAGGPLALIAGAILGVVAMALTKRKAGLEAAMLRTSNYGSSSASIEDEAVSASSTLDRAKLSSARYNQDEQAMKAAVQKIAATGVRWDDIDEGITDNIARMAQLGVDTVDGLTDAALQRTLDTGVSMRKALSDMVRESDMALASGVEYDTFTKGMQEMEGAVKTLNRSTGGLAKTFMKNARVAKELGLSYNRMVNASLGLTQKATNFDEGFSMLRLERELALATEDAARRSATDPNDKDAANMAQNLRMLQEQVSAGTIDKESAARFFAEIGGTKTQNVLTDRIDEVAKQIATGGVGSVKQAEARLGTNLSFDEFQLLKKYGDKGMDALSPQERSDFEKIKADQAENAKRLQEAQPMLTVEAYLEKLLTEVSNVLIPAIEAISDGIDFVKETFQEIRSKGFMRWMEGPTTKELVDAQTKKNAETGLDRNMNALLRSGEDRMTPIEKVRALAYDDRLASMRVESAGQRRALEQFVDPETANSLARATRLEAATGDAASVQRAKQEAASIRQQIKDARSMVRSDGTIVLTIPASALQSSANVTNAQGSSTNPVGQ